MENPNQMNHEYPHFPLIKLLNVASVLFNTKSGKYITWEYDNASDQWDFNENGSYMFSLGKDHMITHAEDKEFILYEDDNECWYVRPFYEVDVADFLVSYGTAEYTEEEWGNMYSNVHSDAQGAIDDAATF